MRPQVITDTILPFLKPFDSNVQNLSELDRKYIKKIDPMNKINESNFEIKKLSYSSVLYISKKFYESLDQRNDSDFTREELEKFYKLIQENPTVLLKYNQFSETLSQIIEKENLNYQSKVDFKKAILNTNDLLLSNLNKYSIYNEFKAIDYYIFINNKKIFSAAKKNDSKNESDTPPDGLEELKMLLSSKKLEVNNKITEIDEFKNNVDIDGSINIFLADTKPDSNSNNLYSESEQISEIIEACTSLMVILNTPREFSVVLIDKEDTIISLLAKMRMKPENFVEYLEIKDFVDKNDLLYNKIARDGTVPFITNISESKTLIENFESDTQDPLNELQEFVDNIKSYYDKNNVNVITSGAYENCQNFISLINTLKDNLEADKTKATEDLNSNINETFTYLKTTLEVYLTNIEDDSMTFGDTITEIENLITEVDKLSLETPDLENEIKKYKDEFLIDSDNFDEKSNNVDEQIDNFNNLLNLME